MSKIDLDKAICSIGNFLESSDNSALKECFNKVLSDQNFKYENGEILEKSESVNEEKMNELRNMWKTLHDSPYRTDGLRPQFSKKYKCIKDVFMADNDLAFKCGNIYQSEYGGCLTNEWGNKFHNWDEDDFLKYFRPVERVFKEGQWITDGIFVQRVIKVNDETYVLVNDLASSCELLVEDVEKNYHLWTIKDAEDGDVVIDDNGYVCLFKEKESCNTFYSHCYLSYGIVFDEGGLHDAKNIRPADCFEAKKLRDKLTEKNIRWDSKEKKLVKIFNVQKLQEIAKSETPEEQGYVKLNEVCSVLAHYLSYKEIAEIRKKILNIDK